MVKIKMVAESDIYGSSVHLCENQKAWNSDTWDNKKQTCPVFMSPLYLDFNYQMTRSRAVAFFEVGRVTGMVAGAVTGLIPF
jgi:hypothetical protein